MKAFDHTSSSRLPSILGALVIFTACVFFACALPIRQKHRKTGMKTISLSMYFGAGKNSRKSLPAYLFSQYIINVKRISLLINIKKLN
jgi:hypothetical protein